MSTKQRLVVLIVVVLVCVIVLLWLRGHGHEAVMGKSAPAESTASSEPVAPQSAANQASSKESVDTASQPPPTQKPSAELRSTFEALNDNEIEFYGRAVDQFGEPVAGAEVKGTVIVNTGTHGGEMRKTTATDAQGYFQFGGFKGQDLGIVIAKDGYEYRRHDSSFSYSYFEADHKRHIPDPKNPVLFLLWKKQGAESLIHYEKVWRFPVNQGPIRIDLAKAKITQQEADLIVTISRTPLRMRYGERGFAWDLTIDIEGGGLLRAGQQDYYNQAPASNYQARFTYRQEAQNPDEALAGNVKWTWSRELEDTFFVSSRNGKYFARVDLRIKPNSDRNEGDNEALIAAEVWLNPNGSHNLEYDPAKATTPKP